MKIIQSFWSKPLLWSVRKEDLSEARRQADLRLYLMSVAYSSLQLACFYKELQLVTDETGKHMLMDELGLPYTNVVTVLDSINRYDPCLWALGKILAYSLQDEPFLHVDNDAFIWERFPSRLETAGLAAQHMETGYGFYMDIYKLLALEGVGLPACIHRYRTEKGRIDAYNMGVTGGHDIAFFKQYTAAAFQFVDENQDRWHRMPLDRFNTYFEQVLFFCMARDGDRAVELLVNTNTEESTDKLLKSIESFRNAPHRRKFIHLYGDSKSSEPHSVELEAKMLRDYPDMYDRIVDFSESFFKWGYKEYIGANNCL